MAARKKAQASADVVAMPMAKAPDKPPSEAADPAVQFRDAAQGYALDALKVLADLMKTATSEAVRASAANSVIDRAHGRAAQAVRVGGSGGGEDAEGVELRFAWLNPEKS
jgi:hypothetical protein